MAVLPLGFTASEKSVDNCDPPACYTKDGICYCYEGQQPPNAVPQEPARNERRVDIPICYPPYQGTQDGRCVIPPGVSVRKLEQAEGNNTKVDMSKRAEQSTHADEGDDDYCEPPCTRVGLWGCSCPTNVLAEASATVSPLPSGTIEAPIHEKRLSCVNFDCSEDPDSLCCRHGHFFPPEPGMSKRRADYCVPPCYDIGRGACECPQTPPPNVPIATAPPQMTRMEKRVDCPSRCISDSDGCHCPFPPGIPPERVSCPPQCITDTDGCHCPFPPLDPPERRAQITVAAEKRALCLPPCLPEGIDTCKCPITATVTAKPPEPTS